jgi:hypothetical protein
VAMTIEQQRAIAIAKARQRAAQAAPPAAPGPAATPAPAAPAEVDQPWYVDAAQAADDIVRLGANGITFGYADKLAGYMGGEGTEAERAKSDAARDRAGLAGSVAEIGGALLPASRLAQAGITAARAIPAGVSGLKGLAARTLAMGADGAALGALTAAGNDQDIATGAGIGAIAGGAGNVAGEALAKGVGKVAGMFNKKPAIPSVDDIAARKSAAYSEAKDAGLTVTARSVAGLKEAIETDLADFGFTPETQPKLMGVLRQLERISGQNLDLRGLDNLRKVAVQVTKGGDPSERAAAGRVIGVIDDYASNLGPDDVLMGNREIALAKLKEGRSLAKQQARAEMVDDAILRADRQAASAGSGGNIDNATRQKFKEILNNPRKARMFTPEERAMMEQIIRGETSKVVRAISKAAPTGIVSTALSSGLGASVGGPIGAAILPAVGFAAKNLADNATVRGAERLSSAVRAGSLQAATPAPNAVQRLAQSQREALARAMAAGGVAYGVAPR